jgi:hypothetical protein
MEDISSSVLSPARSSSVLSRSSQAPSELYSPTRQRARDRDRDRVRSGRIKKSMRKSSISTTAEIPEHELPDKLDDVERESEMRRYEEMQKEKKFFPRADEWHEDESRLFEILYMRQYSPLMPSFWDMDFKGIPIPDILLQTSLLDQPVIYSVSGNEFVGG